MDSAKNPKATFALIAGLLAYAVFLAFFVGAVPGGSDNSGYFNEARLLSHLTVHASPRALVGVQPDEGHQFLYIPLGFKPAAGNPSQIVPTYPPGFPLMLAPTAAIVGWRHAGDVLLILHAIAAIALTFALGRACGLSAAWSLLGAAVLAASPLFIYTSLQALSDVPATAWVSAAVLAAWKGRERPGWAIVSGLCFSVAFLIRPSDFLVALPMLAVFGGSPRRWILCALGALPGVGIWMAINHAAYGGFFRNGYGAIGNEFHANLVLQTIKYSAVWIPILFGPIVILAPAFAAFVRIRPRWVAVVGLWVASFVAFYSAYRWTHESWWFLRFLLPAAPAFIVAGTSVVQACFEGLRKSFPKPVLATAVGMLVVSCVGAEAVQILSLDAWSIGRGERKYGRACDWMNANLPPGSVLLLNQFSGSVWYFTSFSFVRGDQIDAATAKRIKESCVAAKRPLFAVLYPFESDVVSKLPGRWTLVHSVDDILIERCDFPAK